MSDVLGGRRVNRLADFHTSLCLYMCEYTGCVYDVFAPPRPLSFLSLNELQQDLIRKLLLVDSSKRMTATQAADHPWLLATGQDLAQRNLGKNLEQLRIFNATRKLRAAIRTVRYADEGPAVCVHCSADAQTTRPRYKTALRS